MAPGGRGGEEGCGAAAQVTRATHPPNPPPPPRALCGDGEGSFWNMESKSRYGFAYASLCLFEVKCSRLAWGSKLTFASHPSPLLSLAVGQRAVARFSCFPRSRSLHPIYFACLASNRSGPLLSVQAKTLLG